MIDMKVLTYAPNSTIPPFEDENAYWVEAGLEEFMDLIYPLLLGQEKEMIDRSADWFIEPRTTDFAIEGHLYFLVNRDWSKTLIERAYLPYAGQWNASNPFFQSKEEFQQKISVSPLESNPL
jgi:hypothetical protein